MIIIKIKTMLVQLSMFIIYFWGKSDGKKMLTSAQKISKMINDFVNIKYLSESQFPPKISSVYKYFMIIINWELV